MKGQKIQSKFFDMTILDAGKAVKLEHHEMIWRMHRLFSMKGCPFVACPISPGTNLYFTEANDFLDYITPFERLIGSLLYLSWTTRPNIPHAAVYLSWFVLKQTKYFWTAVKMVLRYLKKSNTLGITYMKKDEECTRGFRHADWGGERTSQKSMWIYFPAVKWDFPGRLSNKALLLKVWYKQSFWLWQLKSRRLYRLRNSASPWKGLMTLQNF